MSSNVLARRQWLKRTLAIGSGIALAGSLTESAIATPISSAEFQSGTKGKGLVLLNANENPYGPSERVRKLLMGVISKSNRYPFEQTTKLKEQIARAEGVTVNHIHLGAGSGALLSESGKAFFSDGSGAVLSAFPTFPILMNHAEMFGGRWDKVDVNDRLECDYNALANAVKSDTRLVFVCNPNNPTGTLVDPAVVRSFCDEVSKKTTVYSDEAYLEFLPPEQQDSMVDLVRKDRNVIVSRTFSKIHGLAGLRLGYLIGRPDLIKKVSRFAGDIPLSQMAVTAAAASMGDTAFMQQCRDKNAAARGVLSSFLDERKILYGKSQTNFLFFESPASGKTILTGLQQRGYLIRIWEFRGKEWCRISIGTLEEMNGLVTALKSVLS